MRHWDGIDNATPGAEMAVMTANAAQQTWSVDLGRSDIPAVFFAAALPIILFIGANWAGELFALRPLFFAPFGLAGWLAGVFHIGSLPLFGVGAYLAWRVGGQGHQAAGWTIALVVATVAFPFLVGLLDSLMLSILSMGLVLLGLSASARVAKVSPVGAMVMAPGLLWLGFSAFLGLSFVASWSPPFGITNASQSAAAA